MLDINNTKMFIPLLLLLFIISVAYAEEIPHPPEYKHFLNIQSPKYEEITNEKFWLSRIELINCIASCDTDPQKIDERKIAEIEKKCIKTENDRKILEDMFSGQQLNEALQFTEKEMNIIKKSRNVHLMVGAGIQSPLNDPLGTEILELASDIESPKGLATISLIDRYSDKLYDSLKENKDTSNLEVLIGKRIMMIEQNSEDNAFLNYLSSYLRQKEKGNDEALKFLSKGNTTEYFNSYSKHRYQAVVAAAEFIGYSKFTSRIYALESFAPVWIYQNLTTLCRTLVNDMNNEVVIKECHTMGKKIVSSSRNNIEKLFGLSIQGLAPKDSPPHIVADYQEKIKKSKQRIRDLINRMARISLHEMPETAWIQYFDISFEKDEEAAIMFLEDFYEKQKQDNSSKKSRHK